MFTKQKSCTLALTFINRNHFGLGRAILHWLRTALNRVRWEENQQFHALERRGSTIPKSTEQAKQVFIATQKGLAVSEKERMERIDQILGTRTYFHEGKVYQERLDSDHLMVIDQIREENPEKSRKELNWQNPQADVKIRYKHKKRYYNLLSKLRIYPKHPPATYQLNDNTNKDTITFLAAQNAYSIISLKPVELAMESIEQESLVLRQEKSFSSAKYCYFRPQHSMVLLRIPKELYKSALIKDQDAINQLQASIESVISLQEVYQALKDYDEDERVAFYLRKIENNRLDYLFSDFSLDREENRIAVTIDLMGDGKEYCVLIKSLINPEKYKPRPIFNLKPPVVFSPDSNQIYFIQRSGEGGWIQLVSRHVGSCWKAEGIESVEEAEGIESVEEDQGIVYRCSAEMQMKLGSIWNSDYIFVTVSSYGREYSENLFLILASKQGLKLQTLDEDGHCKYFYDLWQNGLVIGKKRQINDRLKYGEAEFLIEKIQLIPFKQHIIPTNTIGLSDLQLTGKVEKITPKPQDLDVTNKKVIFVPDSHQFIREVQARRTHLILVLNFESVYDRASLYFLPSNLQAYPHSIIIRGDPKLRLEQMGSNYNSQLVKFSQFQGLLNCQKEYNIWKRELRQKQQSSRYHRESIIIDSNGYAFELQLLCKKMYLSEKQLPVILVLEDSAQKINQEAMQQLLEKGVMLAKFGGRGTQTKDLQHYFAGSKHNFRFMLDDLQAAIQFIGNEMTQNISLFCKGQISSLVGLWFNFYFPNLFNATILHNGLYDLNDQTAVSSLRDFFGTYQEPNQIKQTDVKEKNQEKEQHEVEQKKTQKDTFQNTQQLKGVDLKKFNVFNYKFRETTKHNQKILNNERTLSHIENVIISSDEKHRYHSRKLIKRLRENANFRFDEVYLKEYDDQYQADLFNLSYLYKHIRERMERELNNPRDQQQEEEQKE